MIASKTRATLARIPWQWVQWLAIGVGVIGLGFRLFELGGDRWGEVGLSASHQFIVVAMVLVLSVGLRLRSTLQVLAAALAGFFACTWIAYHVGGWISVLMPSDELLRVTMVVPVIEEVVKSLPLVMVAWTWRRKTVRPGNVDMALAGMAVGAGFAFHEDMLWGRVSSSGVADVVGWILPSVHTQSGLAAGHLVWTGLIGLGIGIARTGRWRRPWIPITVAAALAIVDHGTWNDERVRDTWGWMVAGGWLPIAVFIGGLLWAFLSDIRSVRSIAPDRRILPRDVVGYIRQGELATPLRRWQFGTEMMRITTGQAFGVAARSATTAESADTRSQAGKR